MTKNIELLAPGGDIDSIKAAIIAGADAIYCGLDKFNARNRAQNIAFAGYQLKPGQNQPRPKKLSPEISLLIA